MRTREFKFRAWSTEYNRFLDCESSQLPRYMKGYSDPVAENQNWKTITVQQYAEMKDVDGIEIYEGDIISCEEYMGMGMKDYPRPISVVMWDGCSWCYSLDKTRDWFNAHQILRYVKNIKVLGNIFENSELLK